VPLWAYSRLVAELHLEVHLVEAVLSWFRSPLTPQYPHTTIEKHPCAPPQVTKIATHSSPSSSHSNATFLAEALAEWPPLAVGVLAELCPPLTPPAQIHEVPSPSDGGHAMAQLAFCTDGKRGGGWGALLCVSVVEVHKREGKRNFHLQADKLCFCC
jgi:hypothetical protein